MRIIYSFLPQRALSRKEADPKASQLAKPSVDRTARIGNRVPQGPPGAHAHISSAARRVAQTAAAGASTRYKAMVSTPPSMIPQNPHAMQGWGVAAAAAATAAAGLHGSFNHRGEPIFLEDSPQGSVSEAQARLRVLFNETIPREEWQAAQRHIQELKVRVTSMRTRHRGRPLVVHSVP